MSDPGRPPRSQDIPRISHLWLPPWGHCDNEGRESLGIGHVAPGAWVWLSMALALPSLGLTCSLSVVGGGDQMDGPRGHSKAGTPTSEVPSPALLPSVPTAAVAPATRPPGCPGHPRRRNPRTAWAWEGGREVKLMAPDPHPQIPPKHTLLCWVSCGCDRALCSESRRCYFPAGGLGQAPQPPKPHLICADTHIPEPGSGREDTEIGPPHSSSSPPGPATQSPPTRAPMGEGGETHLGKLGDAPGSVGGRAAVRGPPAPRPGLLHGAQGAQLRAPRERRLQRARQRVGSQAVEPRALIGCQ